VKKYYIHSQRPAAAAQPPSAQDFSSRRILDRADTARYRPKKCMEDYTEEEEKANPRETPTEKERYHITPFWLVNNTLIIQQQ